MALRRQVLRIGGTKNRAQQYKLTLRQRVLKFYICYSNVNETDEDALWHISWCVFTQKYQDALRHIVYEMYLMYECICNNISFVRMWRLPWCDVYDGDMIVDSKGHINTSSRCGSRRCGYLIYIYICLCLCVFVCVRLWACLWIFARFRGLQVCN
jgi:hypothetical protein